MIVCVLGTESQYAIQKMMMLSEKVRPCDSKKRGLLVPAQTATRNARNVALSSSPRQLRHRVVPTPAVDLSPESSCVASVGFRSRHRPGSTTSLTTGKTTVLIS